MVVMVEIVIKDMGVQTSALINLQLGGGLGGLAKGQIVQMDTVGRLLADF